MTATLAPGQARITTWQCASLLLGYPDDVLCGQLDLLAAITTRLPDELGGPLRASVQAIAARTTMQAQQEYVATFDTQRRCSLYLSYFRYGDTRKRGVALLRFRQAYLRAGYRLDDTELPDHLAVVLEFAALVDAEQGRKLLIEQRAGLEVLKLALREVDSPWAGAVAAVSATLPPLRGDEHEAVARLVREGPPEEEVGTTPYTGAAFDPLLLERRPVQRDESSRHPVEQGGR